MNDDMRFRAASPPFGDPQSPAPYDLEGVEFRVFPVEAEVQAVQTLLDDYLNSVAEAAQVDLRWRPVVGLNGSTFVYVTVVTYRRTLSSVGVYRLLGFARQNELLLTLPVLRESVAGVPLAVETFAPIIAVDNDWSMIAGREVVGYPKVMGWFEEMPPELEDPAPIRVEMSAIHAYGPDSEQRRELFLEIAEPETPTVAPPPLRTGDAAALWPFGNVEALYGRQEAFSLNPILDKLRSRVGTAQPAVALKQFRETRDLESACYQAIVGFETRLKRVKQAGLLPVVPLRLIEHDSLPLSRLGIDASQPLTPLFPFFYAADFSLENAVNLVTRTNLGPVVGGPRVGQPPTPEGGLLERLSELTASASREQLEQWRSIAERLADGSYGTEEALTDSGEAVRRALRFYTQAAEALLGGSGR